MSVSHFFQDVPDLGRLPLNEFFSRSHGVHITAILQAPNNKWLKENQRHLLGETALIELQLRTDHDHGTPRVVHTFPKQVLTKTSALALKHIAQRFQRTVAGASYGATMTTIVKQRVNGFL
ncbi:MAG: hypothetical protein M2R45_01377 [Verrucomicrobia subdivision 3 bacterium]|nr:hypothetical protein [Limisphaerales bacterium]